MKDNYFQKIPDVLKIRRNYTVDVVTENTIKAMFSFSRVFLS